MTKINHRPRCAFRVTKLNSRLVGAVSGLAVYFSMNCLAAAQVPTLQESNRTSLKQARDPYFNPKLQADANPAPLGADKRVVNPLFEANRNSTQSIPPTASSDSRKTETGSVQNLPRWEPPILKNSATAKSANADSLSPNRLKSIPEQATKSSNPTNQLAPNSIIRNSNPPQSREIVGDFSADLSSLNRSRQPSTASNNSNPAPGKLDPAGTKSPLDPNAKSAISQDFDPDAAAVKPNSMMSNPPSLASDPKRSAAHNDAQALGHSTVDSKRFVAAPPPTKPVLPSQPVSEAQTSNLAAVKAASGLSRKNPALEPTRLLAMVGNEPIFVGDMLFELNQMIEQHLPTAPEEIKERERLNGINMLLNKYIDSKLLYIYTLDKLPEGADVDKILDQASKEFDKNAAPTMMKSAGINSLADFDAYLRMQGTSLRKLRLHWSKDQLTRYFMSQELDEDKEVSHQELLEVYQKNFESYAIPAKARWEQITVRFDRSGSREEAERLLVDMGNKIVYGANFASVAKKGSHGFKADKGGLHDWIAKGELASKELDEAIFSEEIGKLSEKIETAEGFHIIRVLERTEASHTPFIEAQVKIKEELLSKKKAAVFEKHLSKLRQEIPVVRYDQDTTDSIRMADANDR